MTQRTALITGANGTIGQALCVAFSDAGWRVVGTDQHVSAEFTVGFYISMDCIRLCQDLAYSQKIISRLKEELSNTGLNVLINNAATQIVSPIEELSINDFHTTLDVNLLAPFLLTKNLLTNLQDAGGSIINITSIHAHLTKPNFTAYATSKAALEGMTRSLAVELGGRVRVNAISPAAISTPMLEAGFNENEKGLSELASFHPSGTIGTTQDITDAALYLAHAEGAYLNGTIIGIDGGIGSRLFDPV